MTEETNGDLDGTVAWAALLIETEQRLARAGIDGDAGREARWIVAEAIGVSDDDLADSIHDLATVRGVARLDDMVSRRSGGEPIQYVLGHWAFRHLDLLVDGRVLIPRPETEVVTGLALAELDRQRARGTGTVVDLGTGSGAIGLSIAAERPGTRVVITDRNADALAVARANLAGLGMRGASVEAHLGSWFDAVPEHLLGECDVIVANPPYVATTDELPPAVRQHEPADALLAGPDGLDDLRTIAAGARPWLRATGALVLEMDPRQIGVVAALLAPHGFDVEVALDLAGLERALVARVAS